MDKEQALAGGSILVCGVAVTLWDVANGYALVKVYEAPAELPDTVVIGRLSAYGRVVIPARSGGDWSGKRVRVW